MNSLAGIGIHAEEQGGGDNARALLREIESLLQQLQSSGKTASIDLARLPFTPDDYALLDHSLGRGEVSAEVETLGTTSVNETGIPGVWWVTHYSTDEKIIAESIEITFCPEILAVSEEDLDDGLARLRQTINTGD